MKRKLLIVGNIRFMMKDVFRVDDKEVDQVIRFMGEDYEHILDVIKTASDSDELTDRQKMLVSYIVGNTSGVMQAREFGDITRDGYNVQDIGM